MSSISSTEIIKRICQLIDNEQKILDGISAELYDYCGGQMQYIEIQTSYDSSHARIGAYKQVLKEIYDAEEELNADKSI